jgi:CelD/BcsL family acetyltransferase involved in cellulose biosynthesis
MNVVALPSVNHDGRALPAAGSRIARIEVYEDMAAAEPHWRALERAGCLATPYQAYEFLELWQRHIGTASGVTPLIVVAFNGAGSPQFLWPFGRSTRAGVRVVEFLGGKHVNLNLALWRSDAAARIGLEDLRGALAELAGSADLLMLTQQPLTWAGLANPFALLPHQPSASFGVCGALAPDFEALLQARTNADTRKKMRKKERKLASFGKVRFARASGADEIGRVLDAFFQQKRARMRALGQPDVFAAPGVRQFIEAAAAGRGAGSGPIVELFALSVDDTIVATIGGIVGGGRFCAMFISIEQERFAAESPGEQVLANLVRHCCERGLDTIDLGVGEAKYKTLFCRDSEPLFDSYWPLTPVGRPLAFVLRLTAALKRAVKQQPVLWSAIGALRRQRARLFG